MRKLKTKRRKETALGGAPVDLKKILKGPNVQARAARVYQQIGISQERTAEERKADEAHQRIWKPQGAPAKQVKSYSKTHKVKQEDQKIVAMQKLKGTYKSGNKPAGWNLKKGQTDGDKGRKKASEQRGK